MEIISIKMPDISKYMQYSILQQINENISIVLVFKTHFRNNNVFLDIFLNDISSEQKIVSGKLLKKDSLVCSPNRDVGFSYYINCVDQDGIEENITPDNLHKFYLYFSSYDSGRITEE